VARERKMGGSIALAREDGIDLQKQRQKEKPTSEPVQPDHGDGRKNPAPMTASDTLIRSHRDETMKKGRRGAKRDWKYGQGRAKKRFQRGLRGAGGRNNVAL